MVCFYDWAVSLSFQLERPELCSKVNRHPEMSEGKYEFTSTERIKDAQVLFCLFFLSTSFCPCSALFTRFASLWLHPLPKHYTQAERWLLSIINHSIGWHILPLLFCNVILTTVSAVNESVLHCFDDMMTWQCFDVISCHYVSYSCHNMSHLIPPYMCTTQAVPKTNY